MRTIVLSYPALALMLWTVLLEKYINEKKIKFNLKKLKKREREIHNFVIHKIVFKNGMAWEST